MRTPFVCVCFFYDTNVPERNNATFFRPRKQYTHTHTHIYTRRRDRKHSVFARTIDDTHATRAYIVHTPVEIQYYYNTCAHFDYVRARALYLVRVRPPTRKPNTRVFFPLHFADNHTRMYVDARSNGIQFIYVRRVCVCACVVRERDVSGVRNMSINNKLISLEYTKQRTFDRNEYLFPSLLPADDRRCSTKTRSIVSTEFAYTPLIRPDESRGVGTHVR